MRRLLAALGVALAIAAGAPAATAAPHRVVAVGDVHGAFDELVSILDRAGLLARDARAGFSWAGGDAVLVQTGDLLDRGAGVRRVLDLLMRLEGEAAAAGGRVEVLLGNHEAMNLVAEFRDVGPGALAAFADERPERVRARAYALWQELVRHQRHLLRLGPPRFDRGVRRSWMELHPPGTIEYREALLPEGRYGAWLRERPVMARVGDSLFVHGGISPRLAGVAPEELNATVRRELAGFDAARRRLVEAGVALPFSTRGEMVARIDELLAAGEVLPAELRRTLEDERVVMTAMASDWELFREDGPLWFRGFSHWSEEQLSGYLDHHLADLGVRRVVAAHTPSRQGEVESRLDGRVHLIDTGMLSSHYPGGRASALEIVGGAVRPLYADDAAVVRGSPGAPRPAAATPGTPGVGAGEEEAGDAAPGEAGAGSGGAPPRLLLGPDGTPLPWQDDAEILDFLRTAEVVEARELGEGTTRPLQVVLERDGVRARAIFHAVDVEKRETDQARRRVLIGFRDSYRNQVAAYHVAHLLGLDNVAPAVVRRVGGDEGSLALWIEEAFSERERLERDLPPPDPLRWRRTFSDMRVFDNLIYNVDRNQGNILIDPRWKVWWIDHTRAFGYIPELPRPEGVVRCSRALHRALVELDPALLRERLDPYLRAPAIDAVLGRRKRLLRRLDELIAELGEERVLFEAGDPDPDLRLSAEPPGGDGP